MVAPVGAQEGDVHDWVRGGLAAGHASGRITSKAGAGVRAALSGSDPDPAGGRVVTRHGWPLYSCAGDTRSGEADGQALGMDGGLW